MGQENPVPASMGKTRELKDGERQKVVQMLLRHFNNRKNKLEHGAIGGIAIALKLHPRTVSRIWEQAKETFEKESQFSAPSRKPKNCGRKKKDYAENLKRIATVPLNRRSTIRSLAESISMPHTTLFDRLKAGDLKRVSSAVKPVLTQENMVQRVKFCRTFVLSSGLFDPMYNRIHLDEKWFYLTKASRTYYLSNDEDTPHRTCKSKRYIGKIMFLAAVARPRPGFDGKLGIWPFATCVPVQRSSKNRPRGSPVTQPTASIDRAEMKNMILQKVLPAIRAKFPIAAKPFPVIIQQDNAKPHVAVDDDELLAAGSVDGWSLRFENQPPNSPDLNVLDLGFFNTIQALQEKEAVRGLDDLIQAVSSAFDNLLPETLNKVFLTLQECMNQIMEVDGSNRYTVPHMSKDQLSRRGELPVSISCSSRAFERSALLFADA